MAKNREMIAMNLLTCKSYLEAAQQSGISERTLQRLRKDAEFQKVVQKVKKELFSESMSKAQAASMKALDVLNDIMSDDNATDSSRVSAARVVLELAYSSVEQEEIMNKLAEIERRQNV